jgi:DeoR family ulaG and ulaABCDEF operon transcriptional repressor
VADRVVLVADSSKFRSAAMVRVCPLDDIDCMVTDDGIQDEDASMLAAHGVELIVAPRIAMLDQAEGELA